MDVALPSCLEVSSENLSAIVNATPPNPAQDVFGTHRSDNQQLDEGDEDDWVRGLLAGADQEEGPEEEVEAVAAGDSAGGLPAGRTAVDAAPARHHSHSGTQHDAGASQSFLGTGPAAPGDQPGPSLRASDSSRAPSQAAAAVGAAAGVGGNAGGDDSDSDGGELDADAIARATMMIQGAAPCATGKPLETLRLDAGGGQSDGAEAAAGSGPSAQEQQEQQRQGGVAAAEAPQHHHQQQQHGTPTLEPREPSHSRQEVALDPAAGLPQEAAEASGRQPGAADDGAGTGALAVYGDIDPTEVVLKVQVCMPKGDPRRSQEFLVLGSQVLTDLRDRIMCTTDSVARIYLPEQPAPGGYFYVERTFYNDMRAPGAVDLSEPLRTFPHPLLVAGEVQAPPAEVQPGAEGQLRIAFGGGDEAGDAGGEGAAGGGAAGPSGRFSAALMESTAFEQLAIRLGAPYCYCHQGTCEHIVVFTELRRIRPEDRQTRAEYPVQLSWERPKFKVCGICQVKTAQKTVLRSRLAPTSPCFFCAECFQRLHYDAQGRLLFSDFEVFEHIENTM